VRNNGQKVWVSERTPDLIDDFVIVHSLDEKKARYTAACQTAQTLELDSLFGLRGEGLVGAPLRNVLHHVGKLEMFEEREMMEHFALLGFATGQMLGVPIDELDRCSQHRFEDHYLQSVLRRGYLEEVRSQGAVFVSPTAKFGEGYGVGVEAPITL
jgi:hypothetical protein